MPSSPSPQPSPQRGRELYIRSTHGNHPLYFGVGTWKKLPIFLRRVFPHHRIAIFTDHRVARLYARPLQAMLRKQGIAAMLFAIRPGEHSKTRETKAWLEDQLLHHRFGRDTVLLAVGGGVVGDLTGFVAATYCRGIAYIQIPTTLIAQTDSAIGGKTGIDAPLAKNMIGAFWPPRALFVDPQVLRTLPAIEIRQGLIEMLKHGLIADARLARRIAAVAPILRNPRHPRFVATLHPLLLDSIRIAVRFVARDEHDAKGYRAILNYGHTVGHAIEHASNYRVRHGDGVAMGVVCEARIAVARGLFSPTDAAEQQRLLRAIGAPVTPPKNISWTQVHAAMLLDKKVRNGQVRCVLLKGLGKPTLVHLTKEELLSLRA